LNILSLFGLVSTGPQYLNLGGGDVEKHITLFQACFTHLVELKAVPALRCEPGALLVNSSAVGIGTVLEVYDQLVVIDIPSNWLPPLKRANYKFENMSREFSGEERQVCDNLLAFPSYVNRKFDLGAVQVGDKVVVTNIGAYTHTFASSLGLAPFNGYWVDTENNVTRLTWPIDNTGETLLEGLSAKRMVI
jgi:diaminopimelate decarboxylase